MVYALCHFRMRDLKEKKLSPHSNEEYEEEKLYSTFCCMGPHLFGEKEMVLKNYHSN